MITNNLHNFHNNFRPCILCLSGHDPSGGAGIAADIEAIAAQKCHAASVITALTIQDSSNVYDFKILDSEWVTAEANAIINDLPISAIKLGMLGSIQMVQCVMEIIAKLPNIPVVCDPVLKASGGGKLGKDDVGFIIREQLFPVAIIATPNLIEAQILADLPKNASADQCAEKLLSKIPYLLITDGEGTSSTVINRLYSKKECKEFTCPRLPGIYHGSGCTLASSLSARLAIGQSVTSAVEFALDYTWRTLRDAEKLGKGQFIPCRFLL